MLEAVESALARALLEALLPTCVGGVVCLHDGVYVRGARIDVSLAQQAVASRLVSLLQETLHEGNPYPQTPEPETDPQRFIAGCQDRAPICHKAPS